MKTTNLKLAINFFLVIFLSGFTFTSPALAEEFNEQAKLTPVIQGSKEASRIIISTSGPAKFTSQWLDNPPRLVIEFQTKNVASQIANELLVNGGGIKKITSEYFGNTENGPLKSLTFELLEKVPYKIWQEDNSIILDIQVSLNTPVFFEEGREVFAKNETKDVLVKRLEAMDIALKQMSASQVLSEAPKLIAGAPNKTRRENMPGPAFWFMGLALISGVGLLFWLFWRRYKLILDKNVAVQEMEKLKSQVAEKNKLLEQEELIRKAIENTSLTREKEFDQLKLELQKEAKLLEEEEKARKAKEEELSQKEKESEQVKNSLESLKEILVNKGLAKKISSPEGEGGLWIPEKSSEKRQLPRLDLSKDYNRTIILRIESADKSKSIKSFANNIGLGGLCFETRHEFGEKERISVRLFFFGDRVPMMRIQAKVIWSKIDSPVNRYGICFTGLEEKNSNELNRYIESKIAKG